ncbi:MAG: sulfite exporter TauE/SafE family protein, partial [Phycisphaerales bacterium]
MPTCKPTQTDAAAPRRRLFATWLVAFFLAWGALVVAGRHWGAVLDHWETALAMALGSYVAGSTPMGGGTIGFPVLVLILGEPAELGRGFSLAVQSIG